MRATHTLIILPSLSKAKPLEPFLIQILIAYGVIGVICACQYLAFEARECARNSFHVDLGGLFRNAIIVALVWWAFLVIEIARMVTNLKRIRARRGKDG